jgi:enoyl-CoA hydratase/carnithine racemase
LRGAGPVFSAGHDLRELLNRTLEQEREIFSICADLMQTIQRIPQPVIASVHALATAAGCQLVATCDLAIASENAKFATPGVKIGLFCSTPQVALSRNIGRKRALEMLLTGRVIDARTAADWGLVNRVVAPEKLDAEVIELAKQIANASPLTLKTGKQSFYRQIDMDQASAYETMAQTMADAAMTCDAQEGIGAFIEKRAPVWQGK